jgi:acetate/butyrate---CoA ligase
LDHRGAYLMALSVAMVWGTFEGAVYLWTLPMFHCNVWCYTWALAAFCGTSMSSSGTSSICLRIHYSILNYLQFLLSNAEDVYQMLCVFQMSTMAIYHGIAKQGVTHFCDARVALNNLINAPASETFLPLPRVVNVMVAGSAPTPSLLAALSIRGFRVTHTYGLSETYGPSTVFAWKPEWGDLPLEERSRPACTAVRASGTSRWKASTWWARRRWPPSRPTASHTVRS